jgi:hypothetical protein
MEISKPDDLGDIANLGLSLTEAQQLLARVQLEISSAQARGHAVRRPVCPCRDGVCQVKDYRDHAIATLFGQVTLRLPRFPCAACGREGGDRDRGRAIALADLEWKKRRTRGKASIVSAQ